MFPRNERCCMSLHLLLNAHKQKPCMFALNRICKGFNLAFNCCWHTHLYIFIVANNISTTEVIITNNRSHHHQQHKPNYFNAIFIKKELKLPFDAVLDLTFLHNKIGSIQILAISASPYSQKYCFLSISIIFILLNISLLIHVLINCPLYRQRASAGLDTKKVI